MRDRPNEHVDVSCSNWETDDAPLALIDETASNVVPQTRFVVPYRSAQGTTSLVTGRLPPPEPKFVLQRFYDDHASEVVKETVADIQKQFNTFKTEATRKAAKLHSDVLDVVGNTALDAVAQTRTFWTEAMSNKDTLYDSGTDLMCLKKLELRYYWKLCKPMLIPPKNKGVVGHASTVCFGDVDTESRSIASFDLPSVRVMVEPYKGELMKRIMVVLPPDAELEDDDATVEPDHPQRRLQMYRQTAAQLAAAVNVDDTTRASLQTVLVIMNPFQYSPAAPRLPDKYRSSSDLQYRRNDVTRLVSEQTVDGEIQDRLRTGASSRRYTVVLRDDIFDENAPRNYSTVIIEYEKPINVKVVNDADEIEQGKLNIINVTDHQQMRRQLVMMNPPSAKPDQFAHFSPLPFFIQSINGLPTASTMDDVHTLQLRPATNVLQEVVIPKYVRVDIQQVEGYMYVAHIHEDKQIAPSDGASERQTFIRGFLKMYSFGCWEVHSAHVLNMRHLASRYVKRDTQQFSRIINGAMADERTIMLQLRDPLCVCQRIGRILAERRVRLDNPGEPTFDVEIMQVVRARKDEPDDGVTMEGVDESDAQSVDALVKTLLTQPRDPNTFSQVEKRAFAIIEAGAEYRIVSENGKVSIEHELAWPRDPSTGQPHQLWGAIQNHVASHAMRCQTASVLVGCGYGAFHAVAALKIRACSERFSPANVVLYNPWFYVIDKDETCPSLNMENAWASALESLSECDKHSLKSIRVYVVFDQDHHHDDHAWRRFRDKVRDDGPAWHFISCKGSPKQAFLDSLVQLTATAAVNYDIRQYTLPLAFGSLGPELRVTDVSTGTPWRVGGGYAPRGKLPWEFFSQGDMLNDDKLLIANLFTADSGGTVDSLVGIYTTVAGSKYKPFDSPAYEMINLHRFLSDAESVVANLQIEDEDLRDVRDVFKRWPFRKPPQFRIIVSQHDACEIGLFAAKQLPDCKMLVMIAPSATMIQKLQTSAELMRNCVVYVVVQSYAEGTGHAWMDAARSMREEVDVHVIVDDRLSGSSAGSILDGNMYSETVSTPITDYMLSLSRMSPRSGRAIVCGDKRRVVGKIERRVDAHVLLDDSVEVDSGRVSHRTVYAFGSPKRLAIISQRRAPILKHGASILTDVAILYDRKYELEEEKLLQAARYFMGALDGCGPTEPTVRDCFHLTQIPVCAMCSTRSLVTATDVGFAPYALLERRRFLAPLPSGLQYVQVIGAMLANAPETEFPQFRRPEWTMVWVEKPSGATEDETHKHLAKLRHHEKLLHLAARTVKIPVVPLRSQTIQGCLEGLYKEYTLDEEHCVLKFSLAGDFDKVCNAISPDWTRFTSKVSSLAVIVTQRAWDYLSNLDDDTTLRYLCAHCIYTYVSNMVLSTVGHFGHYMPNSEHVISQHIGLHRTAVCVLGNRARYAKCEAFDLNVIVQHRARTFEALRQIGFIDVHVDETMTKVTTNVLLEAVAQLIGPVEEAFKLLPSRITMEDALRISDDRKFMSQIVLLKMANRDKDFSVNDADIKSKLVKIMTTKNEDVPNLRFSTHHLICICIVLSHDDLDYFKVMKLYHIGMDIARNRKYHVKMKVWWNNMEPRHDAKALYKRLEHLCTTCAKGEASAVAIGEQFTFELEEPGLSNWREHHTGIFEFTYCSDVQILSCAGGSDDAASIVQDLNARVSCTQAPLFAHFHSTLTSLHVDVCSNGFNGYKFASMDSHDRDSRSASIWFDCYYGDQGDSASTPDDDAYEKWKARILSRTSIVPLIVIVDVLTEASPTACVAMRDVRKRLHSVAFVTNAKGWESNDLDLMYNDGHMPRFDALCRGITESFKEFPNIKLVYAPLAPDMPMYTDDLWYLFSTLKHCVSTIACTKEIHSTKIQSTYDQTGYFQPRKWKEYNAASELGEATPIEKLINTPSTAGDYSYGIWKDFWTLSDEVTWKTNSMSNSDLPVAWNDQDGQVLLRPVSEPTSLDLAISSWRESDLTLLAQKILFCMHNHDTLKMHLDIVHKTLPLALKTSVVENGMYWALGGLGIGNRMDQFVNVDAREFVAKKVLTGPKDIQEEAQVPPPAKLSATYDMATDTILQSGRFRLNDDEYTLWLLKSNLLRNRRRLPDDMDSLIATVKQWDANDFVDFFQAYASSPKFHASHPAIHSILGDYDVDNIWRAVCNTFSSRQFAAGIWIALWKVIAMYLRDESFSHLMQRSSDYETYDVAMKMQTGGITPVGRPLRAMTTITEWSDGFEQFKRKLSAVRHTFTTELANRVSDFIDMEIEDETLQADMTKANEALIAFVRDYIATNGDPKSNAIATLILEASVRYWNVDLMQVNTRVDAMRKTIDTFVRLFDPGDQKGMNIGLAFRFLKSLPTSDNAEEFQPTSDEDDASVDLAPSLLEDGVGILMIDARVQSPFKEVERIAHAVVRSNRSASTLGDMIARSSVPSFAPDNMAFICPDRIRVPFDYATSKNKTLRALLRNRAQDCTFVLGDGIETTFKADAEYPAVGARVALMSHGIDASPDLIEVDRRSEQADTPTFTVTVRKPGSNELRDLDEELRHHAIAGRVQAKDRTWVVNMYRRRPFRKETMPFLDDIRRMLFDTEFLYEAELSKAFVEKNKFVFTVDGIDLPTIVFDTVDA